jgi:hypothetical protein
MLTFLIILVIGGLPLLIALDMVKTFGMLIGYVITGIRDANRSSSKKEKPDPDSNPW